MLRHFATWTDTSVQRIGVLHIAAATTTTCGKVKLVIETDISKQVPRPLETESMTRMQQDIRLEGTANAMSIFDIRPGPARMNFVRNIDTQ